MRQMILYATVCLLAAVVGALKPEPTFVTDSTFPGWPTQYEGRALRPTALTDAERRFAAALPGRLGKFTDGRREFMLQWVTRENRLLHSATDCMANAGFDVKPEALWVDEHGNRWLSATVARGDQEFRVRERIYDTVGGSWPDVSSWYWATAFGDGTPPWWMITIVERVESEEE